ncbi:MAG: hypothetical protein HFH33_15570 [Eubacterium sp.]|nr:hypothetical protein [Eubacterium sp.]
MRNIRKVTCGCLSAAMLLTALTTAPVTVRAASEKMNKTSAKMTVGEKMTLKVLHVKKGAAIKWSTTDKSVAAVNAKGVVTAKEEGKATIKAVVSKKTLKCKVTVKEAADTGAGNGADTNTDTNEKDVSALLAGKTYKGTAATPIGNIDVIQITFGSDGTAEGTQMNQATMVQEKFTGTYKAVLSGKKLLLTVGADGKSLTQELIAENEELTRMSATKEIAGMEVKIIIEEI